MKRIIILLLAVLMLVSVVSCAKKTENGVQASETADDTTYSAETVKIPDVVTGSMTIKDYGIVTFEIYPNKAPQSALNFIYLVNAGHFNGVIVDRLVKNYVIQFGNYSSGFVPKKTEFDYKISGEFRENGFDNDLTFTDGAIAWMYDGTDYNGAHTSLAIFPDSTTTGGLNGKYAVFGYITGEDSFAILKKILKKKTYQDRPVKEIMITSVTLDPVDADVYGADFAFPEPKFIKAGG